MRILPVLAVLALMASSAPLMAGNAVRLTTASPEYCALLTERLARTPGAEAPRPRALAEAGQRLCAEGQTRDGIAQLRRAFRAARAMPG